MNQNRKGRNCVNYFSPPILPPPPECLIQIRKRRRQVARCHCHLPATFLRFALQMSGILFIRAVSSFFLVATAGAGERKTETEGGGVGGRGGGGGGGGGERCSVAASPQRIPRFN